MKSTVGLLSICLAILGLSVSEPEVEVGGGKKAIFDPCEKDSDCETTKCCPFQDVKYCQNSCETSKTLKTRIIQPPEELCSPAKKRFRIFKDTVTWWHAMLRCCEQGNGTRLADIETPADEQYFRKVALTLGKNNNYGIYIGGNAVLSQQKVDLKYMFVGTKKRGNFSKEGFDNWKRGEHCLHLRHRDKKEFNDIKCFRRFYYMCYYPKEPCE